MDVLRNIDLRRWDLCLIFILLFSRSSTSDASSWSWFANGPAAPEPDPLRDQRYHTRPTDLSKFDIETGNFLSNSRGMELVEKARHQTSKHSCWRIAYSGLLSSCREILKEEEKKARLAMRLANCFLKVSKRDAIHCPDSVPISKCTSGLSDHTNSIFLAFFIDAASMCHHLQSEAFKEETEYLINELKGSAHQVEDQLRAMEIQTSTISQQNDDVIAEQKLLQAKMQEQSNLLIAEYHHLHAEMREGVEDGFSGLSSATREVHEQLRGVESLQKEVSHNQEEMLDQQQNMSNFQHILANSLSMEFATLHDRTHEIANSMSEEFNILHVESHAIADSLGALREKSHVIADALGSLHEKSCTIAESLDKEFSGLHEKSHEISQSLTKEFSSLHGITRQVDDGVQRSLTGQRALLDGQVKAEEGLHNLKQLQETAFEESRASVQALTREIEMHQKQYLAWQTEFHTMQKQMTRQSTAMLEAQESFVAKQAAIFTSLERLSSLQNSILLESRALRTFLFYFATSIFIYMSTSAKQTHNARPLLYCGLFFTLAIELLILRFQAITTGGWRQTILSLIFPRSTYGVITVLVLVYHVFSYRDYARMSYEVSLDVQERLKSLLSSLPNTAEDICQQSPPVSNAPFCKVQRCNDPYGSVLSKKIVRLARACRSIPMPWIFPSWSSDGALEEDPSRLASCDNPFNAQAKLDEGFQGSDYKPPEDVVSPVNLGSPLTPIHSYKLRPRRSRLCPDRSISSPKWKSVDAFEDTIVKAG